MWLVLIKLPLKTADHKSKSLMLESYFYFFCDDYEDCIEGAAVLHMKEITAFS